MRRAWEALHYKSNNDDLVNLMGFESLFEYFIDMKLYYFRATSVNVFQRLRTLKFK